MPKTNDALGVCAALSYFCSVKRLLTSIGFGFLKTLSHLPLSALYVLADILRPFVWGYRRKVVMQNLRNSFPDKSKRQIAMMARDFYHFFCDLIAEQIKFLTISEKEIRQRMRFEGIEEMEKDLEEEPFVFIYLGHYGNWEWISTLGLWLREGHHAAQLYKPLHDSRIDALFLRMRSRFGAECIEKNIALRRIVQMKQEGHKAVIGFISDQTPRAESIHHWVEFLHQDTPIFTGTERIAKKVGAAIYFADVERPQRGRYVCRFRRMEAHASDAKGEFELTEHYMRLLEEMIRRRASLWLWSHRRWKRKRTDLNGLGSSSGRANA
ncbi:MAG: lysophospholipid acyltransferase family protein [Bacteroidaceae bacterium]|nr:lysophospholipid acyltransferase family protein [Bacteroidaceae bacterium]